MAARQCMQFPFCCLAMGARIELIFICLDIPVKVFDCVALPFSAVCLAQSRCIIYVIDSACIVEPAMRMGPIPPQLLFVLARRTTCHARPSGSKLRSRSNSSREIATVLRDTMRMTSEGGRRVALLSLTSRAISHSVLQLRDPDCSSVSRTEDWPTGSCWQQCEADGMLCTINAP